MAKGKKDNSVSREHFDTVMWNYFEQLFYTQAELFALQEFMIKSGVATESDLSAARARVRERLKSHLDTLRQATPEKRLAFLRGVQGPLQ